MFVLTVEGGGRGREREETRKRKEESPGGLSGFSI